jgi:tripartite-type tricarboxylate transporter receptor subunit TctC
MLSTTTGDNPMKSKRIFLALAISALTGTGWTQTAAYPSKTLRIVVGFAPGGAADYVARSMSEAFSKAMGQPVIVENKPGAGSSIAADHVAKSAPDGYTLLIASPSSISVNPALNPKLKYKPSDLLPVSKMTTSQLVLAVTPSSPIKSVADLIAAAKKEPGQLNYATSGIGSAPHLGMALFTLLTDTSFTQVPYKGGSHAIASVMSGETQVTFGTSSTVLPQAKAGKLRAIAVSTKERTPLIPDLPGMREAGLPNYNMEFWYGMFVPAGTPDSVVSTINKALKSAMQNPAVQATLAKQGTEVALSETPQDFAKFLQDDEKFWVKLVKAAGVKIK